MGLMVIQISPYLKDTTLSFTVRTLIYQLLMATGFMALVPQLRCEQPRLPVAGMQVVPDSTAVPQTGFLGGNKSFRGDLIEKKGDFLTPDAVLSKKRVPWALKSLRRGETAAAEFWLLLRDLQLG